MMAIPTSRTLPQHQSKLAAIRCKNSKSLILHQVPLAVSTFTVCATGATLAEFAPGSTSRLAGYSRRPEGCQPGQSLFFNARGCEGSGMVAPSRPPDGRDHNRYKGNLSDS